jgi:hypothetical protein
VSRATGLVETENTAITVKVTCIAELLLNGELVPVKDKFDLGVDKTYVVPFPELKQKPACKKPTVTTILVNGKASTGKWLALNESAKTLTVKPTGD